MIRLALRGFGMVLIAAALAAVTVDAARSIAASMVTLTELEPVWFSLSPESLARFQEFVQIRLVPPLGSWVWNPVTTTFLTGPVSVELAILGFLLLLLGVPRPRRGRG
jgi:hypothetical protein